MLTAKVIESPKQQLFREMVFGTLVYAVVLGFFEDFTDILTTWSYSVTFSVAFVMQVLTYATFGLKAVVVNHFRGREGRRYIVALVFGVWAITFFSKFVFLAVINMIFGKSAEISGFIGLIFIILAMSLVKKFIDVTYARLA